MIISIFLLILGCLLLWKGADWMVEGATDISVFFRIPDLIIGLSLLAFGTSAPELFVNIFAAIEVKHDIIFGNIIGSNIANILLILGCTSIVYPLKFTKRSTFQELPFSIVCIALLYVLMTLSSHPPAFLIWHSIVLLLIFSCFLLYLFKHPDLIKDSHIIAHNQSISLPKSFFIFFIGFLALPIGAKVVINSAISLSQLLHIPETIISLFAVALGTSLPELVTSLVAAKRKKPGMVVGNIIGSNIFNILFVLGTCGLFGDILFNPSLEIDLFLIVIASIVLLLFVFIGKRYTLDKKHGGLLLIGYMIYMAFLYYRGLMI